MGAARTGFSISMTPLLLRLVLGVTFVWAGWGKAMVKSDFEPDALARLANMGVQRAIDASGRTAPATLPEPGAAAQGRVILVQSTPAPAPGSAPVSTPPPSTTPVPAPVLRSYTAADFAGPAPLPRLYGVALLLEGSAQGDKPIWPKAMGEGPWPVRFAQALAWTELVGGALLIVGVFTPLAAFAIFCTMAGALWLTQIGPATLGGGANTWWVLPPVRNFSTGDDGWKTFLWQLLLLVSALSLMFSGGGALSADRWIFGARGSSRGAGASYNSDDDEDED